MRPWFIQMSPLHKAILTFPTINHLFHYYHILSYLSYQLVMPGSIAEMNTFKDIASATSRYYISLNFPDLQLNLHDKDIFELIYNR